jgi:hypothetical protein
MGKRRKTYKEKVIADLRRKVYSLEGQKPIYIEAKESKITNNMPIYTQASTTIVNSHHYLTKDIFKTAILTGAILSLQFVLYFLLKNHIFVLPMVRY